MWEKNQEPEPQKAALTFDLAGGTLDGKTGTVTLEASVGDSVEIPAAPTREGYTFRHWADSESEYDPGDKYTVEGDHAFAAVWEKDEPKPPAVSTITYDLDGGTLDGKTGTVEVEVENGTAITLPEPTRDGHTFKHWADSESEYDPGDKLLESGDFRHSQSRIKIANLVALESPIPVGLKSPARQNRRFYCSLFACLQHAWFCFGCHRRGLQRICLKTGSSEARPLHHEHRCVIEKAVESAQ